MMKHDEGITLDTVDHMGRVHAAQMVSAPLFQSDPPAPTVPAATEYHAMLDAIEPVLPHYAELVTILRGVFGGVAPMGDFDRESDRVTDDMERVEKYHNSTLDDTSAAWALGVLSNLCDIARSTQNARNCLRSMAGHPAG